MRKMDPFQIINPFPTCVGTGLVVLDVVINERSELLIGTGGSCGNVLSILASMGWNSYPLARIGNDVNSKLLLRDLKRWNVKTSYLTRDPSIYTPMIIERMVHDKPGTTHEFEFKCPYCGEILPKNKLITNLIVGNSNIPLTEVFYFDRISDIILEIVKKKKSEGTLIVFEPCSRRIGPKFYEAVGLTDIIKYSAKEFENHVSIGEDQLEIQTLGTSGLRFRLKRKDTEDNWRIMHSHPVEKVVDTAGAGDLCTAGVIHLLGQRGREGFLNSSYSKIEYALRFGQALAALGCNFRGARGHMYNLTKSQIKHMTMKIMENKMDGIYNLDRKKWNNFKYHCRFCN